jgi:putative hemolysin
MTGPSLNALTQGLKCGKLTAKLATTDEERDAVFKLRYEIFNEELGEGIPENQRTQRDQDPFDQNCHHLMLLDKGKVVATARLLHGTNKPDSGFYTETEFDISGLKLPIGETCELGRVCVDADYRKQTTLMSLFWALKHYMTAQRARDLMGCASLPPMSADDAEATFADLVQAGQADAQSPAHPLTPNAFVGRADRGSSQIPQLVVFYVQFGAKICGRPAFDPVWKCYDLLMLFDMDHLSAWGIELLERFDKRLLSGS